jgi:chromosome segregation ATPase
MSAERHYTRPPEVLESVQENLENACCLYEELDAEIEKLKQNLEAMEKKRKAAWFAFKVLQDDRNKIQRRAS